MKKVIILIILLLMLPVVVNAESGYLYDVLKNEAESNGLAREYTGEHHDSFDIEPSKKIYHWYAVNDDEGEQVLEKNNVLFGDFCWQMIRTTDTGGVKLLYNGIPNEGKCTAFVTSIKNQSYNNSGKAVSDVGYMYNKRYLAEIKNPKTRTVYKDKTINTSYWYSENITWNTSTNKWELDNPVQIGSSSNYSNMAGKYTFFSTSQTTSQLTINYVANVAANSAHYIEIEGNKPLSYYNDKITYGSSYTDNGDGTYTIKNPSTLYLIDYNNNNYSNIKNNYVCINADNNTCSELIYIIGSYSTHYSYLNVYEKIKYANSFTYENGIYTLSDDSISIWDHTSIANKRSLTTRHYTCFNDTGECETIYYFYLQTGGGTMFYIPLTEGKTIEEALNEMLYADDVNTIDSEIKKVVDNWYSENLSTYEDKIEDTIFCNDRSTKSIGGWDPNGGSTQDAIKFRNYNDNPVDLSCPNETDKFSTKNNKAKLTYPVGLINNYEMDMLKNHLLKKSNSDYWLLSPNTFTEDHAVGEKVGSWGALESKNVTQYNSVRPSISLKPNTLYYSGDGSKDNPYNTEYTPTYSISVEIKNETEDFNISIDDLTHVEEGEQVNFRVTPIKGFKTNNLTIVDEQNNEIEYTTTDNTNYIFTMPATNVTIKPNYERVKNAVIMEDNINTKEYIIEVNDATAVVYEDTVRFKLEPEVGYEVESIDIRDEEQNKISYKKTNTKNEFEFTMPDTDVTISPKYRKLESNSLPNPNTKRQILLIVISVIILSIMTFIFIKKKKKN